jgi:NADPH-dependent 2,4-dienoyl-CoA reductase/sulfur reductase-like enzyme
MVLKVTHDKKLHIMNPQDGYKIVSAETVILAMGCRERTRGAIGIPGTRPAGVFTAGAAQRYVNIEGYMVGKRVVILGSGDIGLIMARRMTLEGAKVLACIELMPYSNGLSRNIVQCLDDYGIPLFLSHTITEIKGKNRVEGVCVQKVDKLGKPIPGTEINFDCDTVLLSVGLIPENELTREAGIEIDHRTRGPVVFENMETSVPGIFACGNVAHVHDLVDYVTAEGFRAGAAAARFCQNQIPAYDSKRVTTFKGINKYAELFFRVKRPVINAVIELKSGNEVLCSYKRNHMAPGEMEKIIIPKEALETADGLLTISVAGE